MSDHVAARRAVAIAFIFNGFVFATLVSRLPDVRDDLSLTNGGLGLLLFSSALGSVLALPASGRLIERWGAATVVRAGAFLVAASLLAGAAGTAVPSVVVVAVGLFGYGVGTSVWDVAMNVEGAAVEQGLGRTIMPRFHAGFSLGTVAGAGLGIPVTALGVPMLVHWGVVGVLSCLLVVREASDFLPVRPPDPDRPAGRSAWREPRTLAIGLMVLGFATAEGAANDWLTLALIDGHDARHWVGVVGLSVFVSAMTLGRLLGPIVLDRFGRAPVLWATSVAAAAGILLVVLAGHWLVVGVGIAVWGLGASLGFPVGMSAAADDPRRAAARVSVVSTLGYAAFLAGPPLVGQLADRVGTLESLLAIAALMVPAALAVFAVRRPGRDSRAPV